VLAAAVELHDRESGGGLWCTRPWLEAERVRRLLRLGLPAAGQVTLEVAAFALATALVGRLAPEWLAAHHITLTMASVTFMVPLGLASAGAVRVGHSLGRGDRSGAGRAGWAALALGAAFMLGAALIFLALPGPLVRLFSADPRVIAAGVSLLIVAALFQLFDGFQVVATGVLRGTGDTRTPMLWNLAGHWFLGLPVGYYLGFVRDLGALGLWIGLLVGLTVTGIGLVLVWARTARRLSRGAT
jgi:MATE family multidrug resistance protein